MLYHMKKTEVKISSFQAENCRLQLLYVSKVFKSGIIKTNYEIRENRKKIYNEIIFNKAILVYARCIDEQINNYLKPQTKK